MGNLNELMTREELLSAYAKGKRDFSRANLTGANLTGANLTRATLTRANLTGANLERANLNDTNLTRAYYAISTVLMADWGDVSDETCAYLMRYDASALPDGLRLMREWAAGGDCPLRRTNGVLRVAHFHERRKAWDETLPPRTLWEIWEMLASEKGVKIR